MLQAVCVTACGNFGLAGSSAGEIRMWNMQSGRERRSFALTGSPPGDTKSKIIATSKTGKAKEKAKAPVRSMQAITGLVTDALNTTVIASTLEGKLYVSIFCRRSGAIDAHDSSSTSTPQSFCTRCNCRPRSLSLTFNGTTGFSRRHATISSFAW